MVIKEVDKYVIWASSHYLTEPLPPEYVTWDESTMDDFLVDHAWEPFEYYSPDDLWTFIADLAHSAKDLIKDKG